MEHNTLDSPAVGGPVDSATKHRAGVGKWIRIFLLCGLVAVATAPQNCSSETLFKSNFDATALNQPPSATQAVGTAHIGGVPGSVLVAQAPPDAAPPAKWLRINRPNDPSQISIFQAVLKRRPGNGTYVFTSALVIPKNNNGPASVQFETLGGEGFLHYDLMPDGRVRIDDDQSTTFGTFPLDQVFLIQVTLTISDTSAKARMVLSGAGASGQADRNITAAPLVFRARQFEAVRLFIGFPHLGTFHAANVVVTRKS